MSMLYKAGIESSLFYAGYLGAGYTLEPGFRKGGFGAVAFAGGLPDVKELETDFAIYAQDRSPKAGQAFDAKYGSLIRLACEVSELASSLLSFAIVSSLPRMLLPNGSSMEETAVMGLVSIMFSSIVTVPLVQDLAISTGEKLLARELQSDFEAYRAATSPEKKQEAADRFIQQHGSTLFLAIKTAGMVGALATTFGAHLWVGIHVLARSIVLELLPDR